jgi:DNA polymerase elongation subunit (family B)
VQEQMRNGQIELEKYIITKSLTKAPEDYPDAKNQPHVQVRFTCFFFHFLWSWFVKEVGKR